jgi:ABC-2 type transport system permease protein
LPSLNSSAAWFQLIKKEWRELTAARSFWLLLLVMGPLVGHAFVTAVNLYAEASGSGGGPAALAQGLTPLDGILSPTFGAYDLAAMFLFPFVAIRMIAAEKQSGGLKLLLQLPGSLSCKVGIKGLVFLAGWLLALVPGFVALLLWKTYGGHLHGPETLTLLAGHLLRAILSGGIAVAAAAVTESAASAAIVTLGITVGTWALDFIASARGGFLQVLASYTPTAALRFFEQGLLRLNTVLVILALGVAGFALAVIWLHTGRTLKFRGLATSAVVVVMALVMLGATSLNTSWDLSENRRNSFAPADEARLRRISQPLRVTVFLAAEDPRLNDFEQNVLRKLRRSIPHLEVDYGAAGRTGLFPGAEDHYGEVWYEMNGRKLSERSIIEEVVLEQIYQLAGVDAPEQREGSGFPGYPLAAQPKFAAWIFYGWWPALVILGWWIWRRFSS